MPSFAKRTPSSPLFRQQMRSMGNWPKIHPRRIRVITCDITGTLVSFRGSLEEHYVGTARKIGIQLDPDVPIGKAFNQAYREMSSRFPCFGGNQISSKEWWRQTVLRSFELCNITLTDHEQEAVFSRIYARFGSLKAYEKFEDTLPFLHWVGRQHVVSGVLSNADDRYGDSILPMLGVTHDELQFQLFSKDAGIEKPDPRFFAQVIQQAEPYVFDPEDPLLPSHCLHIGNGRSR